MIPELARSIELMTVRRSRIRTQSIVWSAIEAPCEGGSERLRATPLGRLGALIKRAQAGVCFRTDLSASWFAAVACNLTQAAAEEVMQHRLSHE